VIECEYVICLAILATSDGSPWISLLVWPHQVNDQVGLNDAYSWQGKKPGATKPTAKSAYDFIGSVYCFIVLLCDCLVPGPTQYISYSYSTT